MKRIVRLNSDHTSGNVTDIFPRVTGKQPLDPLIRRGLPSASVPHLSPKDYDTNAPGAVVRLTAGLDPPSRPTPPNWEAEGSRVRGYAPAVICNAIAPNAAVVYNWPKIDQRGPHSHPVR